MRIAEWARRVWYLLNRSRLERQLQQEMEAHREMMHEHRRFGDTLRLREASRDVWGWNWLDAIVRDLRYAIRGLRREKTFAAAAILTLALGIATTTTVFSVTDAELWKPLRFPNPEQLVAVYCSSPAANSLTDSLSGADLQDWRNTATAFSELAAVGRTSRQVIQLNAAQSLLVMDVTANYFSTLGRQALAGTIPISGNAYGRSAILTDRGWKRLVSRDPSIIGRAVTLNDETVVIAGVVPVDDSLGPDPDLFLLMNESAPSFLYRGSAAFWSTVGRLRPGATANVAREQLQAVETRLSQSGLTSRAGHLVYVEDLRHYYGGGNWRSLYFFLAAATLVLLLSVVNVATLLLARAFRRSREFAIRGALGAARNALARHLLVEGGLLALCGAAVGAMLSLWAVGLFTRQLPADFLQRGANIPIDYRVYAFVFTLVAIITVTFGMTPLVLLRRVDASTALRSGVRAGASLHEGRAREGLLICQIALTVILMTAAGIFLKSFTALTAAPLGFDGDNIFVVRASLLGSKYANDPAMRTYANEMLDIAAKNPNVRAAAIASSSPLGSGPVVSYTTRERAGSSQSDKQTAILRAVSAGYFQTLGIKLLQGRPFSAADGFGGQRVAIINQALARRAFGDDSAVGRTLELEPGARVPWTRKPGSVLIVGVAANVKDVSVNEVDFGDIYVSFDQTPAPWVELIVRPAVQEVSRTLSQEATRLDPGIPVSEPVWLTQRISEALQTDRFNAFLVCAFAVVALALAAIGVFGTVSYNVQARAREMGVRLALGAQPTRLFARALYQAGRMGLIGGFLGLVVAIGAAVVIGDALYLVPGSHTGMLYGVTTTDPLMLGAAFIGIIAVAVLASLVPARRVYRVDPVSTLRME